jgi:hypothetical protein
MHIMANEYSTACKISPFLSNTLKKLGVFALITDEIGSFQNLEIVRV